MKCASYMWKYISYLLTFTGDTFWIFNTTARQELGQGWNFAPLPPTFLIMHEGLSKPWRTKMPQLEGLGMLENKHLDPIFKLIIITTIHNLNLLIFRTLLYCTVYIPYIHT